MRNWYTVYYILIINTIIAAEGDLDTNFDSDGILTTAIGSGTDEASGIAIQSDGKIVVVGHTNNVSNDDVAVVRYNSDGSLDSNFGTGGKVTTDISSHDWAKDLAIQSDGKIVVVGTSHPSGPDFW